MKLVKKTSLTKIFLFAATVFIVPAYAFEPSVKRMTFLDKKFPVEGFVELLIAIGLIFVFKLAQKKNRLL